MPKAHPCWDRTLRTSVALPPVAGEVSVDHRVITGQHGESFSFSISDGQMDIILGNGSILAHDDFMIDLHAAAKWAGLSGVNLMCFNSPDFRWISTWLKRSAQSILNAYQCLELNAPQLSTSTSTMSSAGITSFRNRIQQRSSTRSGKT